jgi:hypothetical protein
LLVTFFLYLYKYDDQFVMTNFDGDPTADSEQYNKLERPSCDECESRVSSASLSFVLSVALPFQYRFIYSSVGTYLWTGLLVFQLNNSIACNFFSLFPYQAVMKRFSVNGLDPIK